MEEKSSDSVELRRVKRLLEKRNRYASHLSFLEDCLASGIIPKGFSMRWKMNLDATPTERMGVTNILNSTSLELMQQCIEVYPRIAQHPPLCPFQLLRH